MSGMPDASRPDQDARERALAMASERIRSAGRSALLATCRWVVAEGTGAEVAARNAMDRADGEVIAALELYERVRGGSATGHELLGLLRDGRDLRKS